MGDDIRAGPKGTCDVDAVDAAVGTTSGDRQNYIYFNTNPHECDTTRRHWRGRKFNIRRRVNHNGIEDLRRQVKFLLDFKKARNEMGLARVERERKFRARRSLLLTSLLNCAC
jgi:hypothetical protein